MTKLIATVRTALAKRRAYHRALNEIAKLDARDLDDLNVDRGTLITGAYSHVYGAAR